MIQFQYQVLRYQPDKVGEEFMNLGVVVFVPDSKECTGKYLDSVRRLSAFFPAGNNVYIKSLAKAVADGLDDLSARGKRELNLSGITDLASITKQVLPGKDSALYFTEVRTGLDQNLQLAVDNIYDRMVTRYLHEDEHRASDKEVWSKVYRKYFVKHGIEDKLTKRTVQTPIELFNFERTWKNGHTNCLETVNFDLKHEPSVRDKVHRWFGKLMLLRQASEDLHIYLLSQLPKDPTLRKFIEEVIAEAADPSMKVDLVDETEADKKVKELAEEMEAHG